MLSITEAGDVAISDEIGDEPYPSSPKVELSTNKSLSWFMPTNSLFQSSTVVKKSKSSEASAILLLDVGICYYWN